MEEEKKTKYAAIVLAAGSGNRMHSDVKKQFMDLCGMPVVVHSLKRFEECDEIGDVVLVTGRDDVEYALSLTLRYELQKVKNIVVGGDQRYKSVYNGLRVLRDDTDFVLIHDGARPLLTDALIRRCCAGACTYHACVAAVPVKDTIKRSDEEGFAAETPDRRGLYAVQTPQAFSYPLFVSAYQKLYETIRTYHPDESAITDDAMIVEGMTDCKVRLIEGEYTNLKITTPEDILIARALCAGQK